jgi:predicted ribosome quality control (RQC) complex YloA/Tae2 family protein
MRVKVDFRKTASENAAHYYDEAKKIKKKMAGLGKAIENSEEALKRLEKEAEVKGKEGEVRIKTMRKKEWFEAFRWFVTSSGRLVVAGRDAKQNETLVSRYFEEGDLFFHADIQGAPATILKDGKNAGEEEMKEVAQFAGSYSSAWKVGAASVDVYAVEKEQVKKHAVGGYIPTGGFAIIGKRIWFRNAEVGLRLGMERGELTVIPNVTKRKLEREIAIFPGGKKKSEAAGEIAKRLGVSVDDVLGILPSGLVRVNEKV